VRAFEATGRIPDDLRMDIDTFRAQVIADRGGLENLTALEAAYISKLVDAEIVYRLLVADIVKRGLFTEQRRVRNTHARLLRQTSLCDRLAQRVGVDRRARALPTLRDYLTQRAGPLDHQQEEPA
jgi:hypothetical protein